jgi:hypothetical protein
MKNEKFKSLLAEISTKINPDGICIGLHNFD